MPYILQVNREKFKPALESLPEFAYKGELEYVVFSIMRAYMSARKNRYSDLHDCTYAIMHCADEFRRRFLDKREDEAINENGDIF